MYVDLLKGDKSFVLLLFEIASFLHICWSEIVISYHKFIPHCFKRIVISWPDKDLRNPFSQVNEHTRSRAHLHNFTGMEWNVWLCEGVLHYIWISEIIVDDIMAFRVRFLWNRVRAYRAEHSTLFVDTYFYFHS